LSYLNINTTGCIKEELSMNEKSKMSPFRFWLLIWGLGIAGQLCWNMENPNCTNQNNQIDDYI